MRMIVVAVAISLLTTAIVSAHHSFSAEFDLDKIDQPEGWSGEDIAGPGDEDDVDDDDWDDEDDDEDEDDEDDDVDEDTDENY